MTKPKLLLGHIEPGEYFTFPGCKTSYKAITYRPMNTCAYIGTMWVLNMTTLKAEWKRCGKRVRRIDIPDDVPRGTF